jgi:hypothetical protein
MRAGGTWQRGAIAGTALMFALLYLAAPLAAEPEIKWPVVFTNLDDVDEYGVSVSFYDFEKNTYPAPRLPVPCIVFDGEGGYVLSMSEAFLARHVARGFTHRTTCLGLVSAVQVDPETGERLPSIVFRNLAAERAGLKASLADIDNWGPGELENFLPSRYRSKRAMKAKLAAVLRRHERGAYDTTLPPDLGLDVEHVTEAIPLFIPDCFKNGTPYLDCTWRYGMKSGRKTTQALQDRFKAFGQALDRQLADYVANAPKDETAGQETEANFFAPYLTEPKRCMFFWREKDGNISSPLYNGQPQTFAIDFDLSELTDYRCFLTSKEYPRGYAYALSVLDSRDDAVSVYAILAANDRKRQYSRLSKASFKRRLSEWGRRTP